ncbi:MAG: hypothetical protein FJY98_04265 [Candidatus Liptonbacteria bacterium]|nr:hypothetical protein [Candidatus Liptonbacteria bacterium]
MSRDEAIFGAIRDRDWFTMLRLVQDHYRARLRGYLYCFVGRDNLDDVCNQTYHHFYKVAERGRIKSPSHIERLIFHIAKRRGIDFDRTERRTRWRKVDMEAPEDDELPSWVDMIAAQ